MRQKQRSISAEMVAAVRGMHFAFDDPPHVFDDPYAGDLITHPLFRLTTKSRMIYRLERLLYRGYEPWAALFLGRARWAEDCMEKAVAAGTGQYVILGAGLDSFALRRRDLAEKVKVYEVDHPETQRAKRQRLVKLDLEEAKNLEFVPIDFEKEGLADVMARSSFSSERPAFFSWMGTVYYLSRETMLQTLGVIASIAAPGSEVVFDYAVPDQFHAPEHQKIIQKRLRNASRIGEPFISCFDPQELASEVSKHGFDLVENLSPGDLDALYFTERPDLRSISLFHFAHLRLRSKESTA